MAEYKFAKQTLQN